MIFKLINIRNTSKLFSNTLIILSLLCLFGCIKEKKNDAPVITVSMPQAGITLNAIDSVRVKATITDDLGPLTVSIYITDGQMQVLTSKLIKSVSGNNIDIDELYFFSNKYLQTGIYYLVINTNDGKNNVNNFIEIHISEIPKILQAVYVGVKDATGTRIFCSDSLMNFNQTGFVSSNIISACVNSYSNQMYFLTDNGNLLCYSLNNFQLDWQKTGLFLPNHLKKGEIKVYSFLTYVTDGNGFIYGYDNLGAVRKLYAINNGSPYNFNFIDNYILTSVEDNVTNNKSVQAYLQSAGLLTKYITNFLPQTILQYSNKTALVFAQNQNNVELYTYNFEINYLHSFGTTYAGNFNSAIETPDEQYLLSVGNEINVIEKVYGNSTLYASGKRADILKFESLSNLLYSTDSNNITIYNYPASSINVSYNFNDKVLFFDFLYNK